MPHESTVCPLLPRSCQKLETNASRSEYKGSHVEWDIDECAQPLDRMPIPNRAAAAPAAAPSKLVDQDPLFNRFELLSLDD